MNDDNDPDPVARLSAADPAADVEPRSGFANDVIAQATAEALAGPADDIAPATDLGAERARRRPRWLPVAAVAASIAIVGGLGYGIGASTGGSTDLADGAAPPISLQPATSDRVGPSGGVEMGAATPGMRVGGFAAPESTGSMADRTIGWGFGRNSFSASGLSTSDGSALAYTYDPRSVSNAETVAALAAALGVEGTPELKDGSWLVGPQDGSAPQLGVSLDGTLSFWYSDPRINPWQCVEGTDVAEPCQPVGTLPSEDAAIDALRSIITASGRDASTFEFTSETFEGAVTRSAQAFPVVDGQRLDQSWYLELSDAGIVSTSGTLAPIVELGEYSIVSEQEAFERLSDPRFGAQMTAMPFALREQPVDGTVTEWVPPTEPPATPTSGVSLSWPVNDVEIVSARLGLTSQWQPDGSVLVVPAYEFTDADGGTWSVIAVADSALDFATE
ncbi:hypothetical protein [Agromyces atrinae]|uniref:Uncharacterized protein n=1 Tax=Agromyces atrinae TaxID=592376 RepID=A0A4Q2M4G9_9MICO|nr:hypothetical protein [Agromyces atrinae]NYD67398.1 hypothetical protein [Agromyces atrinae]RXZ86779.1 hypothetical protein ESP50_06850 [Agromyces atrinae]